MGKLLHTSTPPPAKAISTKMRSRIIDSGHYRTNYKVNQKSFNKKNFKSVGMTLAKVKEQDGTTLVKVKEQQLQK